MAHTLAEKTVSLANTYLTDKLYSHSTLQTKQDLSLITLTVLNSKNVIYMIQCNHCSKQYIGETKRRLKDRFNEHRRPVDNPSNISKPTTVSEHFLTNDHSANDITLIPLELTKSNRDSVRKAREAYLIERGKTLEPLGINKKDEMYYRLYFFSLLSFIFLFRISFNHHFYGFCFQSSLAIIVSYCTLFLIFKL